MENFINGNATILVGNIIAIGAASMLVCAFSEFIDLFNKYRASSQKTTE